MDTDKPRLVIRKAEWEGALAQGRPLQIKLVSSENGFPTKITDLRLNHLPPRGKARRHREVQEHIYYVLQGRGRTVIDGESFEWQAGDALFVPSWSWHYSENTDKEEAALVLVATNYPMVKNLGLEKEEWADED